MASATVTATMAAAGFDRKSTSANPAIHPASSLHTPGSGTFPSEMRSPMVPSPSFLKREEGLKTPITPPSAYLDFLKNFSPALMSPLATATSSHLNFHERTSFDKSSDTSNPQPTSQPALSRNTSYESSCSGTTTISSVSDNTAVSNSSVASSSRARPDSPRITIPPSPFAKPGPRSSRTPRRLRIPQSPFSPQTGAAQSAQSPYSSTPLSAAPWSASFSPRDVDPEVNGKPGKVSVRHVVTRTVTYCRTPLEPAPRGKRRKLDEAATDDASTTAADETAPEPGDKAPVVKHETADACMAPPPVAEALIAPGLPTES